MIIHRWARVRRVTILASQAAAKQRDDGYIPLKIRFQAWWEGVDPKAMLALESSQEDDNPLAITVAGAPEDAFDGKWTDGRVQFCRRLWEIEEGDEVVDPGGADYTYQLLKPMTLSSEMSAADLSSGLGGGTRKAAQDLNTYIDGFELDEELAKRAHALSAKHGMDRKVPIKNFDPSAFTLPEKRFNGLLCRERLYRVNNKDRFLGMMFKSLRPRGHMMLTDFVIENDMDIGDRNIEAWLLKDGKDQSLWTAKDYRKTLIEMGMDVRISEDETAKYRSMVLRGWSNFVAGLTKPDLSREFVNEMMREAEYWLLLTRALESGKLRYYRYHAIRGGESIE